MTVAIGLGLDGESQPLFEIHEPAGLLLGPCERLGRLEMRGVVAKVLAVDSLVARAQTTQISSMPLSMASSAMIWSTGLVIPSRSTSGSIAFCTLSATGYCRAPRPAAVITALVTCTGLHPFPWRDLHLWRRTMPPILGGLPFVPPGFRLTAGRIGRQPRPLTPLPQIA